MSSHTRITDDNQSNFYQHLKHEKHTPIDTEKALKMLHKIPKDTNMNILEELEIHILTEAFHNEILNDHTDFKDRISLGNFIGLIKLDKHLFTYKDSTKLRLKQGG